MAQLYTPIGTLKQRIGVLVLISLMITLILHYRASPTQTSQPSVTIVSGPAHQIHGSIDLSSLEAPFITYPLGRVCRETKFVPGLVFLCDNNSGGPGNIRNYILTCLRYAIEAGSTSVILPRIRTRSASDLSNIHLGHQEFSYMFNTAHFKEGLAIACPQIAVYNRVEDVPNVLEKVAREHLYDVEKMIERVTPRQNFGRRGGCDQRDLNRHTDRFGARFREWLNSSATERGSAEISERSPRLMRLNWGVLFDWEVYRDGPEFVATFGGLLRFNDELLALGMAVVQALQREAGTSSATWKGRSRTYLGIHLRTEDDALKEWPSFEAQVNGYLAEAGKQGFGGGLAYLASGSMQEAQKFNHAMQAESRLQVRTKFDLLGDLDRTRLETLSWDQLAVIDFVVLLAADFFVGVSPSSFSINIALRRHLHAEGMLTRPWRVGGDGDGRSWLVGEYERYWDNWLFMYDAMWP